MNAYIKGAISKQILRYLATFKRDVKLVASFASSSHRFAPVEYVGQNDYMALSILQQAHKHSVNYLGISFLKKTEVSLYSNL